MNQEDRELDQLINEYTETMEAMDYEQNMKAAEEKKQEAIKRIIDNKKRELLLKIKEEQRKNAEKISASIDKEATRGVNFTEEEQQLLEELKNADVVTFNNDKVFYLATINDNGEVIGKTYDYDSLSEPMKKMVSRYRFFDNNSKTIELKNSFVKIDSEACRKHISDTLDNWATDFHKMSRNTSPKLIDDIVYNIDTFKEGIDKDGNPVYEGIIDGEKITFADDGEIYDALDRLVPSYQFDGIGFGGDNPNAVDFTKPDEVIQLSPSEVEKEEPIKEEGAKPIQAHTKDVEDMHAEPTKTVSADELLKHSADNNEKVDEKETIRVEGANRLASTNAGMTALNEATAEELNEKQETNDVEFKPEQDVNKKRKTADEFEEERKKVKDELKQEKANKQIEARKKYLLAKDQSIFNFAPIAYLKYKGETITTSMGHTLKKAKGIGFINAKQKIQKMWVRSSLNQKLGEHKAKKKRDEQLLASMDESKEKKDEVPAEVEEPKLEDDVQSNPIEESEEKEQTQVAEEKKEEKKDNPITVDSKNMALKNYVLEEIDKKGLKGQALEEELQKAGLSHGDLTAYREKKYVENRMKQHKEKQAGIGIRKLEQQKEEEQKLSNEIDAIELNPEDMKDDSFDKKKEALKAIRDEIANHPATILENLKKEQQELEKEISLAELNPEDLWTPEIDDKKQRLVEVNYEISKNPYEIHETNEQKYSELKDKIDAVELNPEDNMYPEFEQDKKRLAEMENALNVDPITMEQQRFEQYQALKDKVELVEYNPEDNMYPEYMQDKAQLEALDAEFNMGKSR